ncbi:Tim44 domain-containing protein [Caldimonas brevitalea]|uniref:Preprotein translocase subunit Tim44 n=1 Tax=Caldimonas brevitalea TaxID=413882 RepID=A0A0G3BLL2_9BURK|nr:Tim44-like domain-containing protein [Caldimonas brevitalea]AKJ30272.1 preprotein translocase subunit Tim44 [Caldimonas brevitalea]
MKRLVLSLALAVLSLGVGLAPTDADARRLGGGGSSGMKRQLPPRQSPDTPPRQAPQQGQQAAPTSPAAPGAVQPAPRRSWMGPIAGLAAGLGLAALMSHLGLGAGFANFLTLLLLAAVAVLVVRFLLRRFAPRAAAEPAPLRFAGSTASGSSPSWNDTAAATPATQRSSSGASEVPFGRPAGAASALQPPAFDSAGFERAAKLIFIRMQAANDAGNLDDLRQFTTPEMFASARLDLQERGGMPQRTDVVQLEAQLLEAAREGDHDVVSVRYQGLLREEADGVAAPFDEVWHLVRPSDGSRDWAIAGIQQTA